MATLFGLLFSHHEQEIQVFNATAFLLLVVGGLIVVVVVVITPSSSSSMASALIVIRGLVIGGPMASSFIAR